MLHTRPLIGVMLLNGGPPSATSGDLIGGQRRGRVAYSAEVRDVPDNAREATLWLPFRSTNE